MNGQVSAVCIVISYWPSIYSAVRNECFWHNPIFRTHVWHCITLVYGIWQSERIIGYVPICAALFQKSY